MFKPPHVFGFAFQGFVVNPVTIAGMTHPCNLAIMADADSMFHSGNAGAAAFVTTRWSMNLRARTTDSPEGRDALEQLCSTYRYPLYAYLRRDGRSPHDADDLTQGFFEHLLERSTLLRAHPDKGRFRSFLLGSLKKFVSDEGDKARAQKRGGNRVFVSLDAQTDEDRFRLEPADTLDPEKLYERRWALALLERVFERLQNAYAADGKQATFSRLQVYLREGKDGGRYAEAAAALGIQEGAVKVQIFRMRELFREFFRDEIAQTVEHIGEVEAEIRHLFAVLRR